ncbi:MAG: hypothetical protein ABJG88_00305 [Litorimonas sp.]
MSPENLISSLLDVELSLKRLCPLGGAKCELERERGYEAKEWIVGFTRNVEVSITQEYGLDKYERLVLDLSVSGEDLDQVGITLGYLKPWLHKGRKALSKKPDWCG